MLLVKNYYKGIPHWLSELRIWCCHCFGVGSVPGPETSACRRHHKKKKKKKKITEIGRFLKYSQNVYISQGRAPVASEGSLKEERLHGMG